MARFQIGLFREQVRDEPEAVSNATLSSRLWVLTAANLLRIEASCNRFSERVPTADGEDVISKLLMLEVWRMTTLASFRLPDKADFQTRETGTH